MRKTNTCQSEQLQYNNVLLMQPVRKLLRAGCFFQPCPETNDIAVHKTEKMS